MKKAKEEVVRKNKLPTSPSKSSHYVNKEELLNEIIGCQENDLFSDKLAEMFGKMIDGVTLRFPNLQYYSIHEDAKQDCFLLLIQKYKNFKAKKKTSCFAYFTTIIYNQMRYQLSRAKRYKDHRDVMVNSVVNYMESHRDYFLDNDSFEEN
jgi:DNA-directed RNA polymerase specialized sigma24 family protein